MGLCGELLQRQPADIEILKEIVQEVVSSMANFEKKKRINLCTEQQGGISNICYKLNKSWQYVRSWGFYFIFLSLVVFEL